MRPRVFVVNEPLRLDRDTGQMQRVIDLRPAEEHGMVVHLLPAGQLPDNNDWLFDRLNEELIEKEFSRDDYLLPVGNQTAIMMAAILVSRRTKGRFNILRWNRTLRKYTAHKIEG